MKKKLLLTLLVCLSLLLSFVGCESNNDYAGEAPNGSEIYDKDYGTEGGDTGDSVIPTDRKIITTVNERVETENYDTLIENLKAAVAEMGGYFVSSNYSGNGVESQRARYASFEIRIPAEKLTAFTGKVGELGTVLSYTEKADDITLSYVDTESRIAVLETEEAALAALLLKAGNTEEYLQINEQLYKVRGELASLRDQKKTYDTLVTYSTVHLAVNEVENARSADRSFFSEVGDGFKASLSGIGRFFRGFAIFLLGSSPVLLLIAAIGVGVFFLVRAVVRRSSGKSPRKEAPKNEEKKEE